MDYQFIKEAYHEPDLGDVISYLNNPIMTAKEIVEKYEISSEKTKNNIENKENIRQLKKLIEKDLSSLIKNYCQLTLKYRNKNILKTEKVNNKEVEYTAKDLLLKNVAKVIEEITILEEKINSNLGMDLLVQTRVLNEIGNQIELIDGKLYHDQTLLENKFDYDNFVSINKIQVAPQSQHKSPLLISEPEIANRIFTKEEQKEETTSGNGLLIFLGISLLMTLIFFTTFFAQQAIQRNKSNLTISQISYVKNTILSMNYATTSLNYITTNKDLLKENTGEEKDSKSDKEEPNILKAVYNTLPDNIKDSNGNLVNEFGYTILSKEQNKLKNGEDNEEKGYKISINNIPSSQCPYIINNLEGLFDKKVILNNRKVAKFDNHSLSNLCENSKNNITFYGIN